MTVFDSMAVATFAPPTAEATEATMEIRSRSKTGPVVPSVGDITTKLSHQVDAMKQRWLDQLARDPASFARIEVEIHDHFRHLADQVTATLLAEATAPGEPPESGKRGGPAGPTDRDAPRSRGG